MYLWLDEQGQERENTCEEIKACPDQCTYDDCADSADGHECWVQDCNNSCLGTSSCTVWIHKDEWYGTPCPEQKEGVEALLDSVMQNRVAFNETFNKAAEMLCAEDDCGVKTLTRDAQAWVVGLTPEIRNVTQQLNAGLDSVL